ncbi:hypothetical protein D3C86_1776160 [compost metagenome]
MTCAMVLNNSPATCSDVPTPGVPNCSAPGLDLASAISSCTFLAGTDGLTTSTLGVEASRITGVKSLTMSYGILLYSAPLIECVPTVPSASV